MLISAALHTWTTVPTITPLICPFINPNGIWLEPNPINQPGLEPRSFSWRANALRLHNYGLRYTSCVVSSKTPIRIWNSAGFMTAISPTFALRMFFFTTAVEWPRAWSVGQICRLLLLHQFVPSSVLMVYDRSQIQSIKLTSFSRHCFVPFFSFNLSPSTRSYSTWAGEWKKHNR